jgi:hypothetical protein
VILTLTMWNVMLMWHSHKTLEKNCQHTLYSHLHYYSFHSNFEEKCTNFIASCFIARTIIMKWKKEYRWLVLSTELFSDTHNILIKYLGWQALSDHFLSSWVTESLATRAFMKAVLLKATKFDYGANSEWQWYMNIA